MRIFKTYENLIEIDAFRDRFEYLKLGGFVSDVTFGYERWVAQKLYESEKWRSVRRKVIIRDDGCDLGHSDYPINGTIVVHHIVPLTPQHFKENSPLIFDMDNLICCSDRTHRAIHYGDDALLPQDPIVRSRNDTTPWKGGRL